MAIIEQTVFLGYDVALLLPDPNWRWLLEMGYSLKVEIDQGGTMRQDRKARHLVLRHRLTATWTLEKAETAALQGVLAQLGTSYIGVPIFVDQLPAALWGTKIHDAQWVIEYDETGYEIHAWDALPPVPTYRWFAPLLIGRRSERPRLTPRADGGAQFKLTLLERTPWDFRIKPAAEVLTGVDFPADLEVNWRELPQDWTEDINVYEDVGDGRVEGVGGQEGITVRVQQALVRLKNRSQIRKLLNFFLARKGRVQSFNVPWCSRPGDDTPATPYSTKVVFGDDELVINYQTDQEAESKIVFRQVPWEIAGVEGETPEQPEDAYLFRYTMNVPGGPLRWRFTSWENNLVRTEDAALVSYLGDVFGLMEHDQITQTIDLSDDATTIGSWIFEGNPLVRVMQRTLDLPLEVEIWKCNPATPDLAEMVYSGEVADVTIADRKLTATTLILGGRLDIKVPNAFYGPICSFAICGPGCNNGGSMPEANWTFTGTVVSSAGSELTFDLVSNPPAVDPTDDWFARAWVQKGAAATYELRHVIRSIRLSATRQRFQLKKPFRAIAPGDLISFMPYCTGTRNECENKFGNYINMLAHPHMDSQNLSIPQRDDNSSSGAKK